MIGLSCTVTEIQRAIMSKVKKNFPTPRINYRVDLRHYLTDPYQIW